MQFTGLRRRDNEAEPTPFEVEIETTHDEAVKEFLNGRAELVALLCEAPEKVVYYFGDDAELYLNVTIDVETDERELFGNICTSLPVIDALDRLDRMDDEWFLKQTGTRGFNFAPEFKGAAT